MVVTVCISPTPAVMDEVVQMRVSGLLPHSAVTVSSFVEQRDVLWLAFGHFFADHQGKIDVGRSPSHGGTYRGVLKMGLFTSMVSLTSRANGTRFAIRGSAEQMIHYEINVWKGHLTRDMLHQLSVSFSPFGTNTSVDHMADVYEHHFLTPTSVCQRTYQHPDVVRTLVNTEVDGMRICGALFLPSASGGPYPAVIDLFGGIGGCVESRAALLARHGYATLALAYFAYGDLKSTSLATVNERYFRIGSCVERRAVLSACHGYATLALAYFAYAGIKSTSPATVDARYFRHAITWLLTHNHVDAKRGVALVGVCAGAYFALNASLQDPRVRATVCINPYVYLTPGLEPNVFRLASDEVARLDLIPSSGSHIILDGMSTYRREAPMPIRRPALTHTHNHPTLFIAGEQDADSDPLRQTLQIVEQFRRSGKRNVYREVIPAQGHLLEPPYAPMCTNTVTGLQLAEGQAPPWFGHGHGHMTLCNWGGEPEQHESSQELGWRVVLNFLRTHMMTRQNAEAPFAHAKL